MVNELAAPSRPQWVGIAGVMNPSKQWCARCWGFHTDCPELPYFIMYVVRPLLLFLFLILLAAVLLCCTPDR